MAEKPSEEMLLDRWVEVAGLRVRSVAGGLRRRRRMIVLVHGLGLAADSLREIVGQLAARHPTHAPDLPGFGASDHPRRPLNIGGLADALDRWCEAAGIGDALLVGNSYGAQVVAELAAREAERGAARRRAAAVAFIGATCDPRARSLAGQVWRWARNSRGDDAGGNPLELIGPYRKAGFGRVIRTARSATRHRIEDRLPRLDVPALLIAGDRDAISPLDWNRRLLGLLRDGELEVVSGGAHSMHGTHAGELSRLIADFAQRHR